MHPPVARFLPGLLAALASSSAAFAQYGAEPPKPLPPPAVTWTAQEDQQDMMSRLGIKALRPSASADPTSPHYANYDPAKANPWPDYPDALTLADGTRVTTAEQWWKQRRPELVELFEREVYGRIPASVPKVSWSVTLTDKEYLGRTPVIARRLVGKVDNSAYPLIEVNIDMVLVLPANAHGPVPVLVMFGRPSMPAPAQPNPEELARLNAALRTLLAREDPSLQAVLDKYPAYQPVSAEPPPWPFGPYRPPTPTAPPGVNGSGDDPPAGQQLVAAGWGYAILDSGSIQPDNGASLTRGIIGLVNHGQPRKPDDWGALRAWAWGASRALDYLETDPGVDARHVGIDGVSRWGKAALVTEAFDTRFYMGLIASSGEGGTKPSRRVWGEQLENLTGGEYYWMAGNFLRYGAKESTFGEKTAGDLPVDSPELIALCAPRRVFVSSGIPEHGDAQWLDVQGTYMATIAAQPVFELLGGRGLGVTDDYHVARMPAVNAGPIGGELAWRQHDGGHTDFPNIKYFIAWADRQMGRTPPAK